MAKDANREGVSLAKGPVAIVGIALLAYGITGLIFGGNGFAADPASGTVQGTRWLGLEANGWSNLLFAGAGALLLFGSPLHWGAKSLSLIVGLALGAASVIALVDSDDVFGIFAANGLTKLVWGVAAAVLLVLALLPRVGARKHDPDADRDQRRHETRSVKRPPRTVKREPDPIRFDRGPRATRSVRSWQPRRRPRFGKDTSKPRHDSPSARRRTLSREMHPRRRPRRTTRYDSARPSQPKESE